VSTPSFVATRVATVAVAATLIAWPGPASGQSEPPASTAPSRDPSAVPFPWPTIPAAEDEPDLAPFQPQGPPDAIGRRKGVVVRLWLERPSVGQGEWVQAIVETTNTRSDPVWMWPAECGTSSTRIAVDLRPVVDPGEVQMGKAAAYKRRAVNRSGALDAGFWPYAPPSQGTVEWSFVECMPIVPTPWIRLPPGATMTERFAWYPARIMGQDGSRTQPLPPGSVTVTAMWHYAGHGRRPQGPADDFARRSPRPPIRAAASLELTGVDPGTPSVPELVDRALADPEFRAWVEAHPDGEHWNMTDVDGWSADTPLRVERWQGLHGKVPNGFAEVGLSQRLPGVPHTYGVALLDPWTGDLLDVSFE
jgi:hypothetical protein